MKRLLFVLSMYHGDVAMALDLTRWILELGTRCPDRALVVTTKKATTLPEVGQVIYNLQQIFEGGVEHYALAVEDERGPWFSNNFMFRSVAQYVQHVIKDVDGFYFFEPDCTPTTKEFWDKIKSEYDACGKPFMGDIRTLNHDPTSPLHMNGSGIYPKSVAKYSVAALRASNRPWDEVAREDIIPHAHATRLITTRFNTIEYREVDGQIVTKVGKDGVRNTGPDVGVDPHAVVVHGCKDGSLLKILRARRAMVKKRVLAADSNAPMTTTLGKTAKAHDQVASLVVAAKKKNGLTRTSLTPQEERELKGLIKTIELFCGNEGRTQRVQAMLRESNLLAAA